MYGPGVGYCVFLLYLRLCAPTQSSANQAKSSVKKGNPKQPPCILTGSVHFYFYFCIIFLGGFGASSHTKSSDWYTQYSIGFLAALKKLESSRIDVQVMRGCEGADI